MSHDIRDEVIASKLRPPPQDLLLGWDEDAHLVPMVDPVSGCVILGNDRLYFKCLNAHAEACHGGNLHYELGEWQRPVPPIPCASGYHLCTASDLVWWATPRIFLAEVRGELISSYTKVTAEACRVVRELKFDGDSYVRDCIQHAKIDCSGSVAEIIDAHEAGENTRLYAALAMHASGRGQEVAIQISPLRAAQSVSFRCYADVIQSEWSAAAGAAASWAWQVAESSARRAKEDAFDQERLWQTMTLLRHLGLRMKGLW